MSVTITDTTATSSPSQHELKGTCQLMCPSVDTSLMVRVHRLEQWTLDELKRCACSHWQQEQRHARAHAPSNASPILLRVSAYRRSAAATSIPSSHLRTPTALLHSLHHLLHCVLGRSDIGVPFVDRCSYITDRLRAIKQELIIQRLSSTRPFMTCSILQPMVRYYILVDWILMGEEQAKFDRTLNEERRKDCIQALLQCFPIALRHLSTCMHDATFPVTPPSSSASSSSLPSSDSDERANAIVDDSGAKLPLPSLESFAADVDRFCCYAILGHLDRPWTELQHIIGLMRPLAQTMPSGKARSDSESAATQPSCLTPFLSIALRLCVAKDAHDYATFFSLYRRITDPASVDFDPVMMGILHPHLLPYQIASIRRISSTYQPKSWFSLYQLRELLCLPSVVDAATLVKSLCGLLIRRSDSWEQLSLTEQETASAVETANQHAKETANREWAMAIKARPVEEAEPVVFKAYYQRELKRRIERMRLESTTKSKPASTGSDSWDNDEEVTAAAADDYLGGSASSTIGGYGQHGQVSLSCPLWMYNPESRYPADALCRWLFGKF